MRLQKKILAIVESEQFVPLEGLIISLKIQSGTKNPYFILFPKTDQAGKTELTREDFVSQFEDHYLLGLMDYNGTIETANPVVEVSLFDPTWYLQNRELVLAWPLLKHETTKWSSREEEYKYRVSCRNLEFSSNPLMIDFEHTGIFRLFITPRNAEKSAA